MPAKIRRETAECTNKCRSKDDAARLITIATDEGSEESVVLHRYERMRTEVYKIMSLLY